MTIIKNEDKNENILYIIIYSHLVFRRSQTKALAQSTQEIQNAAHNIVQVDERHNVAPTQDLTLHIPHKTFGKSFYCR